MLHFVDSTVPAVDSHTSLETKTELGSLIDMSWTPVILGRKANVDMIHSSIFPGYKNPDELYHQSTKLEPWEGPEMANRGIIPLLPFPSQSNFNGNVISL